MLLRRELSLMMAALVGLNVLLAFGVIGLLVRMGPAIERILEENVVSIVAAEEILAELASSEATSDAPPFDPPLSAARSAAAPLSAARQQRIRAALERAQSNRTEPDEDRVLAALAEALPATLAGQLESRVRVVAELRELIRINRTAMESVDAEAQRLGSAGAWAAVLVGVLSFALSLVVLGRMRHRLMLPLMDLHGVLEAARSGDPFRRCSARDAALEVRQVLESVNRLLDERLEMRGGDAAARPVSRA